MSDLYYHASYGVGYEVINGEILSPDRYLPESRRLWNDREFSLFIYGDAVEPSKLKSPLSLIRGLIANLTCTYVGRDRENIFSEHLEWACECADAINSSDRKEVVVIDGAVDTSADDFDELLSDIFGIVSKEAATHFYSSSDIVVYWYLKEDDYEKVKQSPTTWGSSVKFYDESHAVMLSL